MVLFYSRLLPKAWHKVLLMLAMVCAFPFVGLQAQNFINKAGSLGIDHGYLDFNPGYGSGVSFHDIDGDGWCDITLPQTKDSIHVYLNDSGSFRRARLPLNNPQYPRQTLWVDFDNDGDKDLFVSQVNRANMLYEDTGNLNFTEITQSANIDSVKSRSFGVSATDYNRDGLLDLYVCNYDNKGQLPNNKGNKLYRNNGNGTFTNVATGKNIAELGKASFQGIWLDVNDDNWPDLYVINDYKFENSLFINQKNGNFKEISGQAGVQFPDQHPMSASATDFDHDGDIDIFSSNSYDEKQRGRKRYGIFLNRQQSGGYNGVNYTDKSIQYGVDIRNWSWGSLWIDRNNDTYSDLFVTTSLFSGDIWLPNKYYENQNADTFVRKPNIFRGRDTAKSFAAAKGDFNHDGFYDMLVQEVQPGNSYLWENTGTSNNNYIKVTLEGTLSNRMAVGSKIYAYVDTNAYYYYTQCGQNYLSQNSQHRIIGIGKHKKVDSLKIEFLSGHRDSFYNLAANKAYHFKEGASLANPLEGREILACPGETIRLDAGKFASYKWNTGDTTKQIEVDTSGKFTVSVKTKDGVLKKGDTVYIKRYPKITHDLTQPTCYGLSNGAISLTFDTLIQALNPKITWENLNPGKTKTGLPADTYHYTYQDNRGCQFKDSIVLKQPKPLKLRTYSYRLSNQQKSAGAITIIPKGGTTPYNYYLDGQKASAKVMGLPRDTYLVKVTDSNGCKALEQEIVDYNALPEVTEEVTAVTCNGSSDGSIQLHVDTLPNTKFKIKWQDGSKGLKRQNLARGVYIYSYKDNQGGSFLDTIAIKEPDQLSLNATVRDASANRKGSLQFKPMGGRPPYTILNDTGKVGKHWKGLSPGNYTITLKDSAGCTLTKTFKIENKNRPDISYKVKPVSCPGASDGVASLFIEGRNPDYYKVQWEGGSTGRTLRNLSAGAYSFQYTDTAGYRIDDSVVVKEPEPLVAKTPYAFKESAGHCQRQLKITGGNKPYNLQVNGKPYQSPAKWLNEGTYQVQVTDAKGCAFDTTINVNLGKLSDYTIAKDQPKCHGNADGSLNVRFRPNVKDDLGIQWKDGPETYGRKGLRAGRYVFNLITPGGCRQKEKVKLSEPDPLSLRTSVQPHQNGEQASLKAVAKGGVPPYQYWLNGNQVVLPIHTLKPGRHQLKVTDQQGCSIGRTIQVNDPAVGIQEKAEEDQGLKLVPNLVHEGRQARVKFGEDDQPIALRVYRIGGRQVWQQSLRKQKPDSYSNIELPRLSAGTYVVQIEMANQQIYYRKLVIVN